MEKFDYIFKMVKKECLGKILDLGCGYGIFCDYLQRAGFDVVAVDISQDALKIAKKRNNKIRFIHADLTNFKIKEKFDTILLFGVLDCLVNINPKKFLHNLKDNLNKGGRILIQVANVLSLQRRLKSILGQDPPQPLEIPCFEFTKKRIIKLIENSGYQIKLFTSTKLWTFRTHRLYMPFDSLATEFFIVAEPLRSKQ